MKSKKKYVIGAALVLALGAAVYVNWQFGSSAGISAKELGAASYVSATLPRSSADEAKQTSALSREQQSYFASERSKRKETQDKLLDDAKKVFEQDGATVEDKSEAQKSVERLFKTFTVQDSIESIIKAKGFADCLCTITDSGVTVIVPEAQLNDAAALVIDDAVTSHYDVSYDKIAIVGL